jgi:hypothetical protein
MSGMRISRPRSGGGATLGPHDEDGRSDGWYLGRIYEIYKEKEVVFLKFSDPLIEEEYDKYVTRNSSRSDVLSLCVSTLVALLYTAKGNFTTYPAQLLRILVAVGIVSNLIRLTIITVAPAIGYSMWRPLVLFLRCYIHLVMTCLPPLSFGGLKVPTSKFGAYMVGPALLTFIF